jgi:hypothetical protein
MQVSEGIQRSMRRVRFRLSQLLTRMAIRLQRFDGGEPPNRENTNAPASVNESAAIIITTFDARLDAYCLPLIRGIRASGVTLPIIVIVNGALPGQQMDRSKFIQAVADEPRTFILSLRVMVGLSRLWNLGIQIASTDICIILNDDLLIDTKMIARDFDALVSAAERSGLAVGNNSWSHFAISRTCISSVGWFEERLLGFGEEDGDYTIRFFEAFGQLPTDVSLSGFINVVAQDRQAIPAGRGKYSLQNQAFMLSKFGFQADLDALTSPGIVERKLPELDAYPAEEFRWQNQATLLSLSKQDDVTQALRRILGDRSGEAP